MGARGTGTIDFGSAPGKNNTTLVVTGQAGIVAGSDVEAFMMVESTADHNADEHSVVPMNLRCGSIVAGTSFTITAVSEWVLTGTFKVRWVWL